MNAIRRMSIASRLYLSCDHSQAEEIVQEAFIRAWTTPGEVFGGTVKAYLLTIARNLYLATRRRAGRQVTLTDSLQDTRAGPERIASGRLELDAVLKAMQTLSEVDRAALLMHAQEDLPYEVIARALNLSIAAVKVRVHRARIRLRQLCEPKGEVS